jgi:hypothetical protein
MQRHVVMSVVRGEIVPDPHFQLPFRASCTILFLEAFRLRRVFPKRDGYWERRDHVGTKEEVRVREQNYGSPAMLESTRILSSQPLRVSEKC